MAKEVQQQCQYWNNCDKTNKKTSSCLECWCKEGRGYKGPSEGKDCKDASAAPGYEFKTYDGPCFITTAVVGMCGFADDCRVMTNLRKLRGRLQTTRAGKQLLKMYDVIGPQIADKLVEEDEQLLTGYKIISEDLIPTACEVESQKYTIAAYRYLNMVKRLAYRYGITLNQDQYAYDSDVTPEQMGHGTARVHKQSVNNQ